MAELVYAFDLKSNGEIHMGSSPISGTNIYWCDFYEYIILWRWWDSAGGFDIGAFDFEI